MPQTCRKTSRPSYSYACLSPRKDADIRSPCLTGKPSYPLPDSRYTCPHRLRPIPHAAFAYTRQLLKGQTALLSSICPSDASRLPVYAPFVIGGEHGIARKKHFAPSVRIELKRKIFHLIIGSITKTLLSLKTLHTNWRRAS